jgi:signal transduction histidine kinase
MAPLLSWLRKTFLGTRAAALAAGLLVLLGVALLEYAVPNSIEVDLLYFLPIFILTWYHSLTLGLIASLVGTAVWLTDERVFASDFAAHLHLYVWNAAIRLGTFLLFVLLLSRIKRLMARERRTSALKSQLIRIVSHEFNNALIAFHAGLYLLRKHEPEPPDARRAQYYEMLDATNERLKLYVKNILNEARMEGGRFKADKAELDLEDVVKEAVESLADVIKQRGQTLTREEPGRRVMVCADREALDLVVGNLLGNAVKYTPENGRITVRLSLHGDRPGKARLEVEDTGPGISAEDIKKITAGFYRTPESRAAAEGFGLGLRISNELLALHDSRLEIESEKGRGSRFSFELEALSASGE